MKPLPIYVASKTVHAPMWRDFRRDGWPIIATWIDEAGPGQTADHADLAVRCIAEASAARATIFYCRPGELHKGSLIEVGAALAAGRRVLQVGECDQISKTFARHPLWSRNGRVESALAAACYQSEYEPSVLVEEIASLGTCDACEGTGTRFGPNREVVGLCPKCHPEGDFS